MFGQAQRDTDDSEDSQIDDVLDELRRQARDDTDLGERFVRLCQGVLRALVDGSGDRVFDRVDVWDEWAGRDGPADGIDLVAQRNSTVGGDAIAIQCECRDGSQLVGQRDVDSFLAKTGSAEFRARMLIHTAPGLGAHLQGTIDSQHKPCHVVDLAELRRWKLDWWAAAEAVGATAPQPQSSHSEAAAGRRRGADQRSSAERLFGQAGGMLSGAALPVAAIVAGVFMVFSGVDIGALVIIGGVAALALRRSTRRRSGSQPAGQPADDRRGRPRPRRGSHDGAQTAPPRSDGWDDDDWLDDDGWDDDEPRADDEWDREDRNFRRRSQRVSREPIWYDREDDLDWVDEHDPLDPDDEPYRAPASRRRRSRSWDDDDYI
ncbi:hypothetical protein [Candidatus Poriferisodalis sp.]|uniref:restriction endonuclease n=1 Tax=Candidatus Poriferisodalis sp. TaxID=3101277 RepID=UPI003B015447